MKANYVSKNNTLKKNIVLTIAMVLISFLFLESLIRFVGFSHKLSHNEFFLLHGRLLSTGFESGIYMRDSLLFWKFRPSQRFIISEDPAIEYAINSKGLREREFLMAPQEDTFRIICMGDSITFGFRVRYEDTYSKVLEKQLNASISSKKFEVINAGVPGYSSLQGLRFLKEKILNYQPDLITICYGQNDFEWPFPVNKVDKEIKIQPHWIVKLQNFLNNLKLYQLLEDIILRARTKLFKSIQISSYKFNAQRVSEEDMVDNITKMIELAKDKSIRVCIMGKNVNGVIKTIAKVNSMPFVDVSVIMDRKKNLLLDGCHPNPEGHKVLAEAIYEKLLEEGIINQEKK